MWFRLPDGDVDGTGYSATGYETLRELWFGSISSITTQPGTATFTLATLSQAISQILSARQPSFLRTLDYLSQYDAGDHSDHLTTGRIVQGLVRSLATDFLLLTASLNFFPLKGRHLRCECDLHWVRSFPSLARRPPLTFFLFQIHGVPSLSFVQLVECDRC